ncbi:MAG TPA: hypothetical protein VMH22_08890 [bacterium]|nr:hypothetical protein [bacterium]
MRRTRICLLAVCLLAAVPALAAEQGKTPARFIKVDALDVGEFVPFGDWGAVSIHPASVTCVIDRVRFGLSASDSYAAVDYWDGIVMLPVHVGYTILSNPKPTWRLWGAVPDVHVDAIGSLWTSSWYNLSPRDWQFSPTVEVAACCDGDYYGMGAGLRVGAYKSAALGYHQHSGIFAELRLRALAFSIGF